jgi:hypothetical protein
MATLRFETDAAAVPIGGQFFDTVAAHLGSVHN